MLPDDRPREGRSARTVSRLSIMMSLACASLPRLPSPLDPMHRYIVAPEGWGWPHVRQYDVTAYQRRYSRGRRPIPPSPEPG